MSSLVDQSDKKACDLQSSASACREFVYQGMIGFYDPRFYNSHFPFLQRAAAATAATVPLNSQ